ncbi:MAG: phosphotriesterase family protein [Planctomycetota bacterium]
MKAGNSQVLRTILLVLISILLCSFTYGKTIYVGNDNQADFGNIQAGIDAADDGDTVLVAPGEYVITEPITFRGKAITMLSEAGPDETTIRMGREADPERGSVVVFENNETNVSVLDGFTITEGTGIFVPSEGIRAGGGIAFDASSGTIRNCTIVQNRAEYSGGLAVYSGASAILINCAIEKNTAKNSGGVGVIFGSSATLTNCIIEGNSATGVTMWVDGFGGGLGCAYDSSLTLTSCTITGNSAGISSGGVFCGSDSSVTVTHCTITSNTSQRYCGVLECAHGTAILSNCLIARNTGAWNGGALGCVWSDSSMTISNCTIWGNKGGQSAGGIGCWHGSSVTVTNSIIWENTSPIGREIEVRDSGSTLNITYSNVAGGQNVVSAEGGSILKWGGGNIDADPLFAELGYWADVNDLNVVVEQSDPNAVWVEGDYHLKSQRGRWDSVSESWVVDDVTSPCIDTGDPNSPVGDEPEPNGGRINMGAYGGTAEASKSVDLWWFETTQGPIAAEGLGVTLPHEHIFTDLRGPGARGYGQADVADVVRVMAPLLEEAKLKGVGVLFECSSIGVGRNVTILSEVSAASGLPVVVPTGVYGRANFAPIEHKNMSEDELTELFISEIREGIEGTGIKAGFIKIATGGSNMNALEEKFLRAAGRAARETGAAVASHTTVSSNATRQADILESISPDIRFIWVHAQSVNNRSLYKQLAERGIYIEFDSLGWNPGQDSTFITAIKDLLATGYGEQILLSHDAGWYRPGVKDGGTQKPYTYLIDTFIPKLIDSGVDGEAIRMITEINPIRAFGFNQDVSP